MIVDTPHDAKIARRNLWWERVIWFIDMGAYLFLGGSGIAAIFATTDYVRTTVQWEGTIYAWGGLLTLGVFAFVGRLFRWWAVEYWCNTGVVWGAFLYAAILIPAVLKPGGSFVFFGMVVCAGLGALRRYAELRIFASEPGLDTFRKKFRAAIRRHTKNTVPRTHY